MVRIPRNMGIFDKDIVHEMGTRLTESLLRKGSDIKNS